jgi:hypothetical protein
MLSVHVIEKEDGIDAGIYIQILLLKAVPPHWFRAGLMGGLF